MWSALLCDQLCMMKLWIWNVSLWAIIKKGRFGISFLWDVAVGRILHGHGRESIKPSDGEGLVNWIYQQEEELEGRNGIWLVWERGGNNNLSFQVISFFSLIADEIVVFLEISPISFSLWKFFCGESTSLFSSLFPLYSSLFFTTLL